MHIDGRALARGAQQLDTALRHVEAAQRIDAPRLVGRARATEAVRAALRDAHDWAMSAAREVQHGGSATADARIAVDRLATEIDAIRLQRNVLSARSGEAFRASVEGARQWTTKLDALSGGTQALDQGTAHAWFTRTLAESADPDELLAARALAPDARVDGLGSVTAGFLRRAASGDERSVELARLALARGGAAGSSALLDDLLRSARNGVDLAMLRDALRGLDDGLGDGARRVPTWLGDDASGVRALDDIELQELELLRRLDDPATLADQARELVARPFTRLGNSDITRIAAMSELPLHARPGLPDSTVDGVTLVQALRTGADPEPHIHRMWLAEITTDTAANAAAAQLLEAGEDTTETARRLGALASEHPAVLGRHADDAWRSTIVHALRTARGDAKKEFASVRLASERTRLIDDPNVTKATLTAELETILAKPDDQITIDDLRRIVLMESQDLDTAKRVKLPTKSGLFTRTELLGHGWLPSNTIEARREFLGLRLWFGRAKLLDDPGVTRETLTEDIARIALKPNEQITGADVNRLALIDELPAGLRPDIPAPATRLNLGQIALHGYLPSPASDARTEFNTLRRWVMHETQAGHIVARQRVAAGEQLDVLALESLALGSEEMLRSVGLNSDDLLRQSLRALRTTSPTDLDAIGSSLKLSKQLLAEMSGTEEMRQLATRATSLMELNIRRLAGNVGGGFGMHPDHAEIGRAIEQAELVLALRAATPQRAGVVSAADHTADASPTLRPAGPAPDPAAGGESLTW